MKAKFVKVWDDSNCGYVNFIILQVEESDTFLTEARFNPGYKFIIEATYKRVGAAGGNKFSTYPDNHVRKLSKKIDSTEADVLGFCINKAEDIYDIPDELHTESFWDVVRCNYDNYNDYNDFEEDCYYKAIISSEEISLNERFNKLKEITKYSNENSDFLETIDLEKIIEINDNLEKNFKMINSNFDEKHRRIYLLFIDKKTLKIESNSYCTNQNSKIADYLWLQNEELPLDLWVNVQKINDGYDFYKIYNLNKDIN